MTNETKRDVALDALVAKQVFGWTARVYRGVFGDTLYIVDDSAQRTSEHSSSVNIIGGSWEKGYDESGALVEFYGRICPAFSSVLADAWLIVERLENIHDYAWTLSNNEPGYTFRIYNDVDYNGFASRADTVPLAICETALKAFPETAA